MDRIKESFKNIIYIYIYIQIIWIELKKVLKVLNILYYIL